MSKIIDKKIEDSILDDLYELGLDGKEARIYLSLIRLGEVGATRICTDTVLHRQFVYQSLYGLEKRGLIQVATIKGRKKFSAKNPKILSNLLAEKNRVADRVIDNLNKVAQIPDEQLVEIIKGDESYVTSSFNLLSESPVGGEVLVISGFGDKFINILKEKILDYEKIRNRKNISIKYIGSEKQRSQLMGANRKNFSYRLLPGDFSDITHMVIWPKIVTLDTFGIPTTQTIIRNPAISSGYKEFFDTLWNIAK